MINFDCLMKTFANNYYVFHCLRFDVVWQRKALKEIIVKKLLIFYTTDYKKIILINFFFYYFI